MFSFEREVPCLGRDVMEIAVHDAIDNRKGKGIFAHIQDPIMFTFSQIRIPFYIKKWKEKNKPFIYDPLR